MSSTARLLGVQNTVTAAAVRNIALAVGSTLAVALVAACSGGGGTTPDAGSTCTALTCPVGNCVAGRCVNGDAGGETGDPGEVDVDGGGIEVIGGDDLTDVRDAEVVELGGLGDPCSGAGDCASGYCIEGPRGGLVCSELCSTTCSVEGYECRVIQNSGGDLVQLCAPVRQILCQECREDGECGLGGFCLRQGNGDFCATPCATGRLCPDGYACDNVSVSGGGETPELVPVCVPQSGLCNPRSVEGGMNSIESAMSSPRFRLTGRLGAYPKILSGGLFRLFSGL
ncbi:MAG: hypothetical protein H6699_09080 [Myxococcales bacterium]|nr:hypothetical protein [Myxococcales bacterium]